MAQLATLIQKMFRGWRCRTQYQLMRKSQILISAWFRGHRVRTGQVLAMLPLPIPLCLALRSHPTHPLVPPQQKNRYKQMKRSVLILQAYARGWKVRTGQPQGHHGTGLVWESRVGGDRGSACPTVGPGAPCVPRWEQIHPHLLSLSFLLLSCLSPASPSRSMSVLVSPLGLPGLSPPQSRRLLRELKSQCRRHAAATTIAAHWRGYQVTGPRALRPPLSCCPHRCVRAVCLSAHPVGLQPLSSPWSQTGKGDVGDVGDEGDVGMGHP